MVSRREKKKGKTVRTLCDFVHWTHIVEHIVAGCFCESWSMSRNFYRFVIFLWSSVCMFVDICAANTNTCIMHTHACNINSRYLHTFEYALPIAMQIVLGKLSFLLRCISLFFFFSFVFIAIISLRYIRTCTPITLIIDINDPYAPITRGGCRLLLNHHQLLNKFQLDNFICKQQKRIYPADLLH